MCVPYVWVVFKTSSCHWDDRHKLEFERGKIVKNHDELWITYHPGDFRYMTHSFLWWFIVAVGSMSTEPENMATWRGTREELEKDQNRSMPRAAMTGQIQGLFSGNIWLVFIVKGLRKKPSRGNNQKRGKAIIPWSWVWVMNVSSGLFQVASSRETLRHCHVQLRELVSCRQCMIHCAQL